MSYDLLWLLLRKGNSYTKKGAPESKLFSTEPGNLLNIHSAKYSGLVNAKTIDIQPVQSGLTITTRKPSASIHAVKSARHSTGIRRGTGARRGAGIAAQKAKAGYRPDLRKAAVARVSALLESQKEKKPLPEKKLRGKRARAVAAAE